MAKYAINLSNGATSNGGLFRLFGKILSGSGIIESGDLLVAAQDTPDMTVKVAVGDAVFVTSAGDTYHGWSTAVENVTISANATGVAQIDTIVAYIDLAAGSATADNPDGLVFAAVRGTAGAAPTSGEIETAIGASNPYIELSDVAVSNGASSINSGNITDIRTRATVDQPVTDSAVTTAKIFDEAVTADKFTLSAWADYTPQLRGSSVNPSIGNGTILGRYCRVGNIVHAVINITMGTTTTFGSGFWYVTLPTAFKVGRQYGLGTIMCTDSSSTAAGSAASGVAYPHVIGGLAMEPTGARSNVDSLKPFTWASGDSLTISITYEADL